MAITDRRLAAASRAADLTPAWKPPGPKPRSEIDLAFERLVAKIQAAPARPPLTTEAIDREVERALFGWRERSSAGPLAVAFTRLIRRPVAADFATAASYAEAVRAHLAEGAA